MTTLVLASASPARLTTLLNAGVTPLVLVSSVDEAAVLDDATRRYGVLEAVDSALLLARAKCEDVVSTIEAGGSEIDEDDLVVVGCDSLLEFDGETLGKPADAAEAVARWTSMSGRSATLHTGHWVIDLRSEGTGATLGAVASTTVTFASLSPAEIEAYVATGEPLNVAGAFTIDGLGGAYVESVEGDPHNVVGISLPLLRVILKDLDIPWHSLWEV